MKLQRWHLSCSTTCQDLSSPANKILDNKMVRNFASCRQTVENPKNKFCVKNNCLSPLNYSQGTQVKRTEKARIKEKKIGGSVKMCKYSKKANILGQANQPNSILVHWLSSSNEVNTKICSYYLSLPAIVLYSKECANPLNITAEQHKISLGKLLPPDMRWPKFRGV